MGKVIQFPTPESYLQFIQKSETCLKVLIPTLTMAYQKQMLDKRSFQGILDYCNVNIYRDLTATDQAILKFHLENYYELEIEL